jgi:hypothetical protein
MNRMRSRSRVTRRVGAISRVLGAVCAVLAVLVPGQQAILASTATGTTTSTANTTTTVSPGSTTTTSASMTTTSSASATTTSTSTTTTTTPPPPPSAALASAFPDSQLQNGEVVTVSWKGFHPTGTKAGVNANLFNDLVGIFECTANPPGGRWFYNRDCMVNNTPGQLGTLTPGDGNGVGTFNDRSFGVTAPDGSGSHSFQVQEGTLHNETQFCNADRSQCDNPNIQCDLADPCVLKVIDYPASAGGQPFPDNDFLPDKTDETQPPFDYGDLLTGVASPTPNQPPLTIVATVPLNFGLPPQCPPLTSGNLSIEGASSSSYALQTWATSLCQEANPITVSYSEVGEASAKQALLLGSTSMAVASLPPNAAQLSLAASPPSFAAAPLTAGGVSIAFVMQDARSGVPITTLRLTPRLAAMLITNSGTLDPTYTTEHDAAYQPLGSWFMHPLTADPEFVALNPGFTAPSVTSGTRKHPTVQFYVQEPMLRAEQNDDTAILTQWIASDFDAQQFLLGLDPCGAQLNRWWQGVSYPTDQFKVLEQGPANPHQPNFTNPPKGYANFYFPVQGTRAVVQHLLYQNAVGFAAFFPPPALPTAINSPSARNSSYFAVMDTVTARRSAFTQATLIAASSHSELANFVNEGSPGPGGCTTIPGLDPSRFPFVAPVDTALGAAYRDMAVNPAPGGLVAPPVSTTDPAAYPLAKIDYALVPTSGINLATADLIASMLRFTAGPGQISPNLAFGYPRLPASLAGQALAVADKVVQAAATSPAAHGIPGSAASTARGPTASGASPISSTSGPQSPSVPPAAGHGPGGRASPATGLELTQLAAEGPVTVDAAGLLTGRWLLPLVAVLALLSGLAGSVLRRRVGRARRREA